MRLPFMFALSYGLQFASITAVLVHTILYEGWKENLFEYYYNILV
jgi:hypothetical protein